ncbi:MAG: hypothetical protein AB2L14_29730 [Candidatus Xenobiia bacterium LiM19]
MPKIVKKTATRKLTGGKKGRTLSKPQRDSLKVDLSLLMKMEEWARLNNSSLGDTIEEAMSEYLEKRQQDAITRMFLEAPEDDEPFTDEERAEAEEGWRECQQGLGRPWSEVRKELAGE